MDCIDYLVKLIDVNRSFSNLSLVKVKSFLEPFDVTHSPDNEDTYLVIGKNLIGYGLTKLGYKHVKSLQGLPNFENLSCDKYDDNVELGDLIAQGIKFDYVIAPDEWLTYYKTEKDQLLVIDQISRITNKGFYTTLKDYKNKDFYKKGNDKLIRNYGIGAQIIKDLKIKNMILITKSPKKVIGLDGYGIKIKKQELI